MNETCELCHGKGGEPVWSDAHCRVVLVADEFYPGYCRVIWNRHVGEFSDLSDDERRHVMDVVCSVERALRKVQRPDKINLASLGNMTPHLHWHVIPRWREDRTFPQAVWAPPVRAADLVNNSGFRAALMQEICKLLGEPAAMASES